MRTVDPWEVVKSNLGIIVGGISTLFLAARILSAAHFDPETASEILQHGGTGPIILGTILSVIGIVLALSLLIFGLTFMPRPVVAQTTNMSESPSEAFQKGNENLYEGFLVFLVVLGAAAVLALVPIALIGILVLEVLFVVFSNVQAVRVAKMSAPSDSLKSGNGQDDQGEKNHKTDSPPPPPEPPTSTPPSRASSNLEAVSRLLLYGMVAAVVLWTANAPPWFPLEKLSIKNSQSVTAYIVSDSGDEMVVLLPRTRQIRYLARNTIIGRTPCEVNESVFLRTLPQLFSSNSSKLIRCPT